MHLWCQLIEHSQTTPNLPRLSRINPLISAEAVLNEPFDYNKTPLTPPGTKVVVYETPEVRGTRSLHGVDGWYIDSVRKHYRCHRVYITKTRTERIARTAHFFRTIRRCQPRLLPTWQRMQSYRSLIPSSILLRHPHSQWYQPK